MDYLEGLDPQTQTYIRSLPLERQNRLINFLKSGNFDTGLPEMQITPEELSKNSGMNKHINQLPPNRRARALSYLATGQLDGDINAPVMTSFGAGLTPEEAQTVPYIPGINPRQSYLDIRAAEQPGMEVLGNFTGRLLGQTALKLGESIGHTLGSIYDVATGDFENMGNNGLVKALQNGEEWVKENTPNYGTAASWYQDYSPLRKMFSSTWWSTEGVDAMSFMGAFIAETYLGGRILKTLGTGAQGAANWDKFSQSLWKSKAGARGVEAYTRGTNLEKLAGEIDTATLTALSVFGEAGFEAQGVRDAVTKQLTGQVNPNTGRYYTADEISRNAGVAARNTFVNNLWILAAPNYLSTAAIFKPFRQVSNVANKLTVGDKAKIFAKRALTTGITEGSWEENIQLATSDYFTDNAVGAENRDTFTGITGNFLKNFGTEEGQLNILPGTIMGLIPGGVGGIRESVAKSKQAAALESLIDKNFLNYRASSKGLFQQTVNADGDTELALDENNQPVVDETKLKAALASNADTSKANALMLQAVKDNNPIGFKSVLRQKFASDILPILMAGGTPDVINDRLKVNAEEDAKDFSKLRDYNLDGSPVTPNQIYREYSNLANEYFKIWQNVSGRQSTRFNPTVNRADFPDKAKFLKAQTVTKDFMTSLMVSQYRQGVKQHVLRGIINDLEGRQASLELAGEENAEGPTKDEYDYLEAIKTEVNKALEQSYTDYKIATDVNAQKELLKARIQKDVIEEAVATPAETTTTTPEPPVESPEEPKKVVLTGNPLKEDMKFGSYLRTPGIKNTEDYEQFRGAKTPEGTPVLRKANWRDNIRTNISAKAAGTPITVHKLSPNKRIGIMSRPDLQSNIEVKIGETWKSSLAIRNPNAYVEFTGTPEELANIKQAEGVFAPTAAQLKLFKAVDFSTLTLDEFTEKFDFTQEGRNESIDVTFRELQNDYKRLKEFTQGMYSWFNSQSATDKAKGISLPQGAIEFTLDAAELPGVAPIPITDSKFSGTFDQGNGWAIYDARTGTYAGENGKEAQREIEAGHLPPSSGQLKDYTGFFALATLPNGIKKWITIDPARLGEANLEEFVADINDAMDTCKTWGRDTNIPAEDINKLEETLNRRYFIAATGYKFYFKHANPTAMEGEQTLPHSISLKMFPSNEPAKGQYLNFTHLKESVKDIDQLLGLMNAQLGSKFGVTFTSESIKLNPVKAFEGFNPFMWETNIHPNIINDDTIYVKLTYHPEVLAQNIKPVAKPVTEEQEASADEFAAAIVPTETEKVTEAVKEVPEAPKVLSREQLEAKIESVSDELDKAIKFANTAEMSRLQKEFAALNVQLQNISGNVNPTKLDNNLDSLPFRPLDEAAANLRKILPKAFSTADITTIVDKLSTSAVPAGVLIDKTVYLHEASRAGVEFHEAGHVVFRHLLTDEQIDKYIAQAKQERGTATAKQINEFREQHPDYYGLNKSQLTDLIYEEYIMDKFMDWKNNRDAKVSGFWKSLFNKILDWIKAVIGNQTELEKLFAQITSGNFKDAALVENRFSIAGPSAAYKILGNKGVNESNSVIYTVAGMIMEADIAGEKLTVNQVLDLLAANQDIANEINTDAFSALETQAEKLDFVKKLGLEISFYNNPANRILITNAVEGVLKSLSYVAADPLSETDEETGSNPYDNDPTERNPYDSLTVEIKKFIGTTLFDITDDFGRSQYIDAKNQRRPLRRAINGTEIYNSLLYSLADRNMEEFIPVLRYKALDDPQMGALFARLAPYINSESYDNQMFLRRFTKAFDNSRVKYLHNSVQKTAKGVEVSQFESNRYNIQRNIVGKWNGAFQTKLLKLKTKSGRKELADKFKAVNNVLVAVSKGEKDPANATKIKEAFKLIGIDLSPGYVNAVAKIDDRSFLFDDKKTSTNWVMPTPDIVSLIAKRITDGVNIFKKSPKDQPELDMLSYMQKLAGSDAHFRSDLFAENFVDATGKRRYSIAPKIYTVTEIHNLQDTLITPEAVAEFKSAYNGYYKYNPLFARYSDKVASDIIQKIDPAIVGDFRQTVTIEEGTENEFERNISGTSFRNIDKKSLLADMLNHALTQKTVGGVTLARYYPWLPSANRTQFAVVMPWNRDFYSVKTGISQDFIDLVYDTMFMQEYKHLKGDFNRPIVNRRFVSIPLLNSNDIDESMSVERNDRGQITSIGEITNPQLIKDRIRRYFGNEFKSFIKTVEAADIGQLLDSEQIKQNGGYMQFLANFALNDAIAKHSIAQLIRGSANATKSAIEVVKRNKGTLGAGPNRDGILTRLVYLNDEFYQPVRGESKEMSDGQVWGTLNYLLKVAENGGNSTKAFRDVVQKLIDPPIDDIKNEPIPLTDDERRLVDLISLKDLTFGKDVNGVEIYHKDSTAWLIKEADSYWDKTSRTWKPLKGKEYRFHLREFLENNDLDQAVYMSASKMVSGKPINVQDLIDGKTIDALEYVREVDGRYQIHQTKFNTAKSRQITYGTQLLQLIDSYLNDETTLADGTTVKQLREKYQDTLRRLHSNYFSFIERMIVNPDGSLANLSNFLRHLRSSVESVNLETALYELFQEANGEFKYDPNLTHVLKKFEELLISTFSPAVYIKGSGRKLIMQSPAGYKVVRDVAGNVIPADEVKKYPDRYTDYEVSDLRMSKLSEGVYEAEVVTTPEMARALGMTLGQVKELDPSRLQLLGIRIPTEGHNSMINAKIVEFIPSVYGDSAIFPPMFYWYSGTDNDSDSIFSYNEDYYFDKESNQWIKYGTAKEGQAKWKEYVQYQINRNPFVAEGIEDWKKIIGTPEATTADVMYSLLNLEHIPVFKSFGLPSTFEEYKAAGEPDNNGATYNELIRLNHQFLSIPELAESMEMPASNKTLKSLIEAVERILPPVTEVHGPDTANSYLNNWTNIQAGRTNIGVAVNAVTTMSYLTKNRIEVAPEGSFTVDGKTYNTFVSNPQESYEKFRLLRSIETAMTDNEKDPLAFRAGLFFHMAPIYTTMIGMNFTGENLIKIARIKDVSDIGIRLGEMDSPYTERRSSRTGMINTAISTQEDILKANKQKLPDESSLTSEEINTVLILSHKAENEKSVPEQITQAKILYKVFNLLSKVSATASEVTGLGSRTRINRWNYSSFDDIDIISEAVNREYSILKNIDDVIAADKFIGGDEDLFERFNKIASKLLISRVPKVQQLFSNVRAVMSRQASADEVNVVRRNFQNYLIMLMFEKQTGRVLTSYDKLLYSKLNQGTEDKTLREQYLELYASNESFAKNALIQYLSDDVNNDTGMDLLNANSFVRLSPQLTEVLNDSYIKLTNDPDERVRTFAQNMVYYTLAKDNFNFRNNSFIRFIAPQMFMEFAKAAKTLRTELNAGRWPLSKSESEATGIFIDLYARNTANWYNLFRLPGKITNSKTYEESVNGVVRQKYLVEKTDSGKIKISLNPSIDTASAMGNTQLFNFAAVDGIITKVQFPRYILKPRTEDNQGNVAPAFLYILTEVKGGKSATYEVLDNKYSYQLVGQLPYHHTLESLSDLVSEVRTNNTKKTSPSTRNMDDADQDANWPTQYDEMQPPSPEPSSQASVDEFIVEQPKPEEGKNLKTPIRDISSYSVGNEVLKEIFLDTGVPVSNREVINRILKAGYLTDPQQIKLAEILRGKPGRTMFRITLDEGAYMMYDPNAGIVYLSPANILAATASKERFAQAYLHEVLHHYTVRALQTPRTPEEVRFQTKLIDLFDEAKTLLKGSDYYGLTLPEEFVSELLTKPDFAEALKTANKAWWKRFIDAILTFFGLSTNRTGEDVYADAVESIIEYVNYEQGRTEIPEGIPTNVKEHYGVFRIPFDEEPIQNLEFEQPLEPEQTEGGTIAPKVIVRDADTQKALEYLRKNLEMRVRELERVVPTDPKRRSELQKRVARIEASIKRLEEQTTLRGVLNIALMHIKDINKMLNQDNPSPADVNAAKYSIDAFKEIDSLVATTGGEFADLKQAVRDEAVRADAKWVELRSKIINDIANQINTGITPESLEAPAEDINAMQAQFLGTLRTNVPVVQAATSVLNDQQFNTNAQALSFDDSIKQIQQEFTKEDLAKVMPGGALVLPFKAREYRAAEVAEIAKKENRFEAIKGKRVPFAEWSSIYKDYADWEKENTDYAYPPEWKAAYEADLAKHKDAFKADVDENGNLTADAETSIREWETLYDPERYLAYVEGREPYNVSNRMGYVYLQRTPKQEKWGNLEEFSRIVNDPHLSKLYNFIVSSLIEAQSRLPHTFNFHLGDHARFLSTIQVDNTDGKLTLLQGLKNVFNDLKESPKGWLHTTLTEADLAGLTYKVEERPFIRPRGFESVITEGSYDNFFDALSAFYKSSLEYQHKTKAEPLLWLMAGQLKEMSGIKKSRAGIPLRTVGGEPDMSKGLEEAYKQLVYSINTKIYGQTRDDKEALKAKKKDIEAFQKWQKQKEAAILEGKQVPPMPEIHVLSSVKLADTLIDYTRLKMLGLNPFSGIGNILIGVESNFIHASRGRDFTDKEAFWALKVMMDATWKYWSRGKLGISDDAKKFGLLMKQYQVLDMHNWEGRDIIRGKLMEKLMTFQSGGEYLIQGQTLLAMLKHTKVTDANGKEGNLWDAYKVENGRLKWNTAKYGEQKEWSAYEVYNEKKQNVSKLRKFKQRLDDVRFQVHGNYTDAMLFKSKWYGRVLMLFRGWLPEVVNNRFGKQVGEDFKGRYRTYGAMWRDLKWWQTPLITLGRVASGSGLPLLGRIGGNKFAEYTEKFMKTKGLSQLDMENYRANIRELQFITIISMIMLALKHLWDDEGDEVNRQVISYLFNQSQRFYQELTFFYFPNNALQIVRDFIPLTKTAQDVFDVASATWGLVFDPEHAVYQRGFRKGQYKLAKELKENIPVWRAAQLGNSLINQIYGAKTYRP